MMKMKMMMMMMMMVVKKYEEAGWLVDIAYT